MRMFCALISVAILASACTEHAPPRLDRQAQIDGVDQVLNSLHANAAAAKGDAYFALFAPDAVYMGTDVSERWSIDEFKGYALPYFNQGKGWVYTKRNRHISVSPTGNTAWFDEVLDSQNYGTSRGTGVLVRGKDGWKISQYHLTFPIPNDLADEFTTRIKAFEKVEKTEPVEP